VTDPEGWAQYRLLVLEGMKEAKSEIKACRGDIDKLRTDLMLEITNVRVQAARDAGRTGLVYGILGTVATVMLTAAVGVFFGMIPTAGGG
jgi:hypothetical protein